MHTTRKPNITHILWHQFYCDAMCRSAAFMGMNFECACKRSNQVRRFSELWLIVTKHVVRKLYLTHCDRDVATSTCAQWTTFGACAWTRSRNPLQYSDSVLLNILAKPHCIGFCPLNFFLLFETVLSLKENTQNYLNQRTRLGIPSLATNFEFVREILRDCAAKGNVNVFWSWVMG